MTGGQVRPVAGIILAAGCGSRMGTVKQLLPFLLERVIQTVRQSRLNHIRLVLGFQAGLIRKTLDLTGIEVIEAPDWEKGQSFSLAAGLKALPPDTCGALFLLGDQPLVSVQTINGLISESQAMDDWIVAPCFNGQQGNPVLVASPLFGRLRNPAGDTGGRVLFHEFKDRMHCLDVDDPGILRDVDTPEDYAALVRDQKGM